MANMGGIFGERNEGAESKRKGNKRATISDNLRASLRLLLSSFDNFPFLRLSSPCNYGLRCLLMENVFDDDHDVLSS